MEELIDDWTFRVPARFPLGCVHPAAAADVELPPDGVVVAPDVVVALDVLDDVVAAVDEDDEDVAGGGAEDVDFFELPPQPASSATAAASTSSTLTNRPRLRQPETLIGCTFHLH